MKTYIILLNYKEDLTEGASWFKRTAKTAEEAVGQVMADLGAYAADHEEALAVEVKEIISVRQEKRWEAHHVEGGS